MSIIGKISDRLLIRRRLEARRNQLARVKNKTFTIFSNDCWGAEVYKYLNLPFSTPFIGLFLMGPCYLEFLRNPRHYIQCDLVFTEVSKYEQINVLRKNNNYPLALLGGSVEIHFLHYKSSEEARTKWQYRAVRINWDNLLVKFDGSKDAATPELVREFERLPYRHLVLLKEPLSGVKSAVVVKNYTTNGAHMFRNSMPEYDLVNWLNTGDATFTLVSWLSYKLLGSGVEANEA